MPSEPIAKGSSRRNARGNLIKKALASFSLQLGYPDGRSGLIRPPLQAAPRTCGSPPSIRWHDLRHTCATLILGRGVHPKMVQHLLGHSSITMTLDRYSHWIPSMGRHAADGMDEVSGWSTADVLLTRPPTRTSDAFRYY